MSLLRALAGMEEQEEGVIREGAGGRSRVMVEVGEGCDLGCRQSG